MRSFEELVQAAYALRYQLRNEGKNPDEGVFHVTQEEAMVLKDQPPFQQSSMSIDRRTICGLAIKVV